MAKGPYLTEDVRLRIGLIARAHPDWKPATVREELLIQLAHSEGWYERDWPSRSTVEKELRKLKSLDGRPSVDEEDLPWSLIAVARYEIPPDVLPVVIEAYATRLAAGTPLTIREAKWVARLSHVLPDQPILIYHACSYATLEAAVWRGGRYPTNRTTFERLLWSVDALTYRQKEPHDPDVERKLVAKYLQMHYHSETNSYQVIFKHPLEEVNDERDSQTA